MAEEAKKLTGAAKEGEGQGSDPGITGTDETAGNKTGTTKKAATRRTRPAATATAETPAGEVKKAATKKIEPVVPKAAGEGRYEEIAARYRKLYPGCKKFHITEDGQVFLDKGEFAARMHQHSLGGGEIHIINMK